MAQEIIVSPAPCNLAERLKTAINRVRPKAIGFVSAFVSVSGIELVAKMIHRSGIQHCRLIAGTDNYITHPEALNFAKQRGWGLRIGRSAGGIFHPKLLVAGDGFAGDGGVRNVALVYVGSANLTSRGLTTNTECGLLAEVVDGFTDASAAFASLWNSSSPADESDIKNYAATFAEVSRKRSATELEELGVNDTQLTSATPAMRLSHDRPPRISAVTNSFAASAWTGLQSFTGEFRFQVEFPKTAGEVVARLVNQRSSTAGRIDVLCTNDNQTRQMQFRFYPANGMFRLNVPNDVPNIGWIREHKDGLALIRPGPVGGAPVRLSIHRRGADVNEIVSKSVALGSWGRTPTRLYGWF